MDTRVWHQIGLELVQIDVQCTIEAQAGRDGADNLSNESVQVLVVWSWDIEISAADVVDRFIIDEESAVRVLDGAVRGEDRVIWFDN